MRNLLLVSNSTQHGHAYLEHCATAARELFAGCETVAFVPYALKDLDGYAATATQAFAEWGLTLKSVHLAEDPVAFAQSVDGFFVGGGNTFRLSKIVHESGLATVIRERTLAGQTRYMGTSAGSNLACATIRTTNDMPIVQPPTFDALGLVPFQINPHFLDADPNSKHMGETRAKRIEEFHEENHSPVIGLREGAWLQVQGDSMILQGTTGAVLFERGQEPRECETGMDLSVLLNG